MKLVEIQGISKHTFDLVNFAKSQTLQNLTTAVAAGTLKVDREELPKILALVQQSIDQGVSTAFPEFELQVKNELQKTKKK
jgi:hypothetical protein